jgi:hypothetical protein
MGKARAHCSVPNWKECGKVFSREVFEEIVNELDPETSINYILLKIRYVENQRADGTVLPDEIWLMRTGRCNNNTAWIATLKTGLYYDWFGHMIVLSYCYLDDNDKNLQFRRPDKS